MRLVTYTHHEGAGAGLLVDKAVISARAAARAAGVPASVTLTTVKDVIAAGREVWTLLGEAAESIADAEGTSLDQVHLGAPVPDPDKILCIGLNYKDHAKEAGKPLPDLPMFFPKYRNSLVGPVDDIIVRAGRDAIDYEAELAFVIGKQARNVSASDALDHVAGLMVFNDVSDRDAQFATPQWGSGKAIDTFGPCGPSLVFLDEIDDVQALKVQTRLNGKTVQDGTTADMVFGVAELIEHFSQFMTLEPGDIFCTGTPAGVGLAHTPPLYMGDGDIVEVEIESLGVLRNRIVVT